MNSELFLLRAACAISVVTWLGCGGSTSDVFAGSGSGGAGGDSGTGSNGGSSSTGGNSSTGGSSAGTGGGTMVDGGSAPFDPGSIGGLLGAVDAGGVILDAGSAGPLPPAVVDGCNALCAKSASANCPNQGTVQSCVVGCRLLENNPACSAQSSALFACEETSPVTCDDSGKATLTNCPLEQVNAVACFLQNAADEALKAPCMTYCEKVAAANCPNDHPAGCPLGCQVIGNFITACNGYWKEYVSCALTATLTCGKEGKAGAEGCGLEYAKYALCTLGGVLNVGDGGR